MLQQFKINLNASAAITNNIPVNSTATTRTVITNISSADAGGAHILVNRSIRVVQENVEEDAWEAYLAIEPRLRNVSHMLAES